MFSTTNTNPAAHQQPLAWGNNNDAETKSCLARAMDRPLEAPCVLLVPDVDTLREGSILIPPLKLGGLVGRGLQARVHELLLEDGSPTGKVLKIAHTDLGHKALNAVWISMEREWELGIKLRVALQEPDGRLEGFMKVCDAIISLNKGKIRFGGMVLEKLNGWEAYKRIDAAFHNFPYVKELLRQVFTSLDRAERETGFFHADMALRNVMEHYPQTFGSSSGGPAAAAREEGGAAGDAQASTGRAAAEEGSVCRRVGWTCTADGRRMPLGPRVELKIIDYGSSYFSEELAQATGGFRARHNYERLRAMFAAKRVEFGSAARATPVAVDTMAGEGHKGRWKLLPTRLQQRFAMKELPRDADVVAERLVMRSEGGEEAVGTANGEGAGEHRRSRLPPEPPQPKMNAVEKMYRRFWRRKGDIFHLLLGMALVLDDRVWPDEDREDVLLFISLVHHVTGVKLKAAFCPENLEQRCHLGQRSRMMGKTRRWLRRAHIRAHAHYKPFNSGITAAEALTSPLFVEGVEMPPPVGSAPLSAVFPRCSS